MAYQVLARKWRPKTFADLVGQEHVVKALKNALDKGRLHHAYLLTGTRGVGKTTIARILAKSLNCETPDHGEPCGQCQSCRDIDQGRFVDLLEIDAASNTGIDNIREVLENAQYAPTAGKYKVYIIDEVHMLSKSAFNAMLKTLEEPPAHVKFILATTDPHKVPITVLSRCLQFVLRNMTPQQVADHLAHVLQAENVAYEAPALALLGRAAQGSMRDALSLLDQAIAMGSGSVQEADVRHMIGAADKRYLYELIDCLSEQNGAALMAKAQEMAANGVGFDSALNDLALLLQRVALLQTVPTAVPADDPEYGTIVRAAQAFSGEQIQLYYQCLIHGKHDLALAPDEYAGFVMTLLRMLAFAPFAAAAVPEHGIVEGTQPVASKKPKQPEYPPFQAADPSPEADKQPENTASAFSGSLNAPSEPTHAAAATETVVATETAVETETVPPAFSGNLNEADNTPPWHNDAPVHDIPFDELPAADAAFRQPEPPAAEDGTDDGGGAAAATEVKTETELETEADPSTPMPAFTRENWPQITQRIGTRISAAQMPLNHMAWIGFENGVLQLAIVQDQTRNTLKKEYFDRIAAVLADAYGINVRIETRLFEAGHGWETPSMYRSRTAAERREQAKALMEQDAAMQNLQKLFHTKWIEASIVLKDTEAA